MSIKTSLFYNTQFWVCVGSRVTWIQHPWNKIVTKAILTEMLTSVVISLIWVCGDFFSSLMVCVVVVRMETTKMSFSQQLFFWVFFFIFFLLFCCHITRFPLFIVSALFLQMFSFCSLLFRLLTFCNYAIKVAIQEYPTFFNHGPNKKAFQQWRTTLLF